MPRVLKFNVWLLPADEVIAAIETVWEIVAPPMVAVMVTPVVPAADIVKVVPAWAPDTLTRDGDVRDAANLALDQVVRSHTSVAPCSCRRSAASWC